MGTSWHPFLGRGSETCPASKLWVYTTIVCPAFQPMLLSSFLTSHTSTCPATGGSSYTKYQIDLLRFSVLCFFILNRLTILPAELLDLWFPLPGQKGGQMQRRILGTVCFGAIEMNNVSLSSWYPVSTNIYFFRLNHHYWVQKWNKIQNKSLFLCVKPKSVKNNSMAGRI